MHFIIYSNLIWEWSQLFLKAELFHLFIPSSIAILYNLHILVFIQTIVQSRKFFHFNSIFVCLNNTDDCSHDYFTFFGLKICVKNWLYYISMQLSVCKWLCCWWAMFFFLSMCAGFWCDGIKNNKRVIRV